MFCRISSVKLLARSQVSYAPLFGAIQLANKNLFSFTKPEKPLKSSSKEHVIENKAKKPKKDLYKSNAAFKLIEIQERYKIFKQGYKVLDLGSSPGGWTQAAVEFTKSSEKNPSVLAIDKEYMDDIPGAEFREGDIFKKETQLIIPEFFKLSPVDVVISDMAPEFNGDLDIDHLQFMDLNNLAIEICNKNLKVGGTLIMKSLNGTMEKDAYRMYKIYFQEFLRVKPRASNQRSSEIYYLGKGYGLSKEYEMIKRIEKKQEKGQKIDDEDIPDLGFTDEELIQKTKAAIYQMYDQGQTLSEEQIKDFKQMPELDIDWSKLKPRTQEQIEKRESNYSKVKRYNDYKKYYGDKLTFTKQKPESLSSLAKKFAEMETVDMKEVVDKGLLMEDMDKIRKKLAADPIEDEGLFLSDEEDYDPYADEDEANKLKTQFSQLKDQYPADSNEQNSYDPELFHTADDQPTTLKDLKFKQKNADLIHSYQKMKDNKKDYLEKIESGEVDPEELNQEQLDDVLEELEQDEEDEEQDSEHKGAEFQVTQIRENRYKDDHLKADDLDDMLFKNKKNK